MPALAAELERARPMAEPWSMAFALHGLGLLACEARDHAAATGYLEEAVALCRRAGNQHGMAHMLGTLALVAGAQDDPDRAADLVRRSLKLARALGYPRAVAWTTFVAVRVSAERAPAAVLARLLGAVDALRSRVCLPLSPRQQAWYDDAVATVRAALGEEAFAAAWAEGRALAPEAFVEATLAAVERSVRAETRAVLPAPPREPRSRGLLSPREQEVLQLVAGGSTNKEIAERLVIAEGTAKYHLTSLLQKLGADNRTQAVAHATRHGLL
jgi:DNA-binding CsgD family transcriptional regulator